MGLWAVSLCVLGACPQASGGGSAMAQTQGRQYQSITIETPQGPARFVLEVAQTPEAQAQGLMFRRSLDARGGMLFVFDTDAVRHFWMKNTYIPLDMLFVDAQGVIVGIVESAEPQSLDGRGPSVACRVVIELAGGTAQRLHIGVGNQVQLSPSPKTLK